MLLCFSDLSVWVHTSKDPFAGEKFLKVHKVEFLVIFKDYDIIKWQWRNTHKLAEEKLRKENLPYINNNYQTKLKAK